MTELSVAVDIAVLDAGINLKTCVRMDGPLLGSIDGSAWRTARAGWS